MELEKRRVVVDQDLEKLDSPVSCLWWKLSKKRPRYQKKKSMLLFVIIIQVIIPQLDFFSDNFIA